MTGYGFKSSLLTIAFTTAATVAIAQETVDPVGWWRATNETPAGEVSTTLRLDYFDGDELELSSWVIEGEVPGLDGVTTMTLMRSD